MVGLGCNNFGMRIDAERSRDVVAAALAAGVNYFDTAEAYGDGRSEEFLGAALADRRDTVVIATKWGLRASPDGPPTGTREAMAKALEGSLRRLGTDYVDHYQLHRPDPGTPVAETLEALAELKAEGKVREIGCSDFSAVQLDEAAAAASARSVEPFASVQNQYSLLTRHPESTGVLDSCLRHAMAFVPYFPLEAGVLTGKYKAGEAPPEGSRLAVMKDLAQRFISDEHMAKVAELTDWAEARDHTLLQLAMSWLVTNEQVASVIGGATKPDQVRANVAAAGWAMTADERADVGRLLDLGPEPTR